MRHQWAMMHPKAPVVEAAAAGWQLAVGHYETANLALTIVAPHGSASAASRYRRAYPGLAYRVPVVVSGGAWPFQYELTTAPTGMTIGETYGSTDYGVISWPSPVAGTYTVAARVTDQQGATATATWTLTVTTASTIFVDATAAPGGTGTIGSPFASIQDFWGSDRNSTTYAGYHVYFKNGTYTTAPNWDSVWYAAGGDNTSQIPWRDSKPPVLLAYPGHAPIIDTTLAGFHANTTGAPDMFIGGITFVGMGASSGYGHQATWRLYGNSSRSVFFENTFESQAGPAASGQNPSHVFLDGVSDIGIVGNTINNLTGASGGSSMFMSETYNTSRVVFENNTISGVDQYSIVIYPKNGNQTMTIRRNTGIASNAGRFVRIDTYGASSDIEICWNNWKSTGLAVGTGLQTNALSGAIYDYRNTYQAAYSLMETTASGAWNATRNVVVHNGTYTQGYGLSGSAVTITRTELLAATSGLVDSTGALTGTDRTTYLGVRGYEVA